MTYKYNMDVEKNQEKSLAFENRKRTNIQLPIGEGQNKNLSVDKHTLPIPTFEDILTKEDEEEDTNNHKTGYVEENTQSIDIDDGCNEIQDKTEEIVNNIESVFFTQPSPCKFDYSQTPPKEKEKEDVEGHTSKSQF